MLTLLLSASLAFAQSVGDFRVLSAETALLRYRNSDEVSATVKEGTKVEVVFVGKNLVRVRSGRDLGWVVPAVLIEPTGAAD